MPKRLITAEDLYSLQVVEDPQLSPSGDYLASVKVTIDPLSNTYRRHIWLTTVKGETPRTRQFTYGPKSDNTPRWSPDGRTLAFVSTRGDKPQIFLIEADGGEARPLTAHPNGASNPVWSPDGKRLAFVARVNAEERAAEDKGLTEPAPTTALEAKHRQERAAEKEKQKTDPRIITRSPFRSGTEYFDDRFDHLYVVEVPAAPEAPLPKPYRLTEGDMNFNAITWGVDGRYIYSIQSREPDYDPMWYGGVVQLNATGKRKAFKWLTPPGHDYILPRVSPDGQWLAALRVSDEGAMGRVAHLAVVPIVGGEVRDLTLALDRNVTQFLWGSDARTLYFLAGDQGDVAIYAVGLEEARPQRVVGGRRILSGFSVDAAGDFAFTAWTPERPSDLYLQRLGQAEQRLTDFNRQWLAEHHIARTETLRFTAPDGQAVQGWLVKPPGFMREKKYPLIVNMHGGPHLMWGPSYPDTWFEWQQQAASGYCVFYCNPRGSHGYGEVFAEATHENWGDPIMQDILAGVDLVTSQSFIDKKRLVLTGGSYAGYMTVWILCRDHRFKCGWAQRGLYNLLSFYGTTDIPYFLEREFNGRAIEAVEKMWQQSPLAAIHQLQTPLAIEHQDNDWRCPPSEAEQLFTVLKRLKREVLYIRYPRDGHEMSRSGEPAHRVDRLQRMIAWFDQHCGPAKKR